MSITAKHRSTYVSPTRYAARRFVRVWSQRWHRNAPAFVGGAASITVAGLIGAMLGTVR